MWWRSVADTLRNEAIGAEMLAYLALTQDEPIECATAFLADAHTRFGRALRALRNDDGALLVSPEVEKELSGIHLFLIGLAQAADPDQKTQYNLIFRRSKGRPKKNIVKVNEYRRAARHIISRKAEIGYHAAVAEAVANYGVDRSEVQAWASHIEAQLADLDK